MPFTNRLDSLHAQRILVLSVSKLRISVSVTHRSSSRVSRTDVLEYTNMHTDTIRLVMQKLSAFSESGTEYGVRVEKLN